MSVCSSSSSGTGCAHSCPLMRKLIWLCWSIGRRQHGLDVQRVGQDARFVSMMALRTCAFQRHWVDRRDGLARDHRQPVVQHRTPHFGVVVQGIRAAVAARC
jgi:hypothetical protein